MAAHVYEKRLNAYSRLVSSETANLCYISMLVFPYTDILPVCLLSGEWLFLFLYRLFHYRTVYEFRFADDIPPLFHYPCFHPRLYLP